ncbi:MAG: IS1634 family transposase [Candidatus Euphemobacter frigidus]|nr:IS1634 family transposase [Candidatus Euphemobacter frigidus]
MFLRSNNRRKDGKDHRYYSIVENRRLRNGKSIQKTLLYLGEINDSQKAEWTKSIDTIHGRQIKQIALFPSDREFPVGISNGIKLDMSRLELLRPRQWGACWLSCHLWDMLGLNEFWKERLPPSREGTEWYNVLLTLVCYRLISPGSEWRLHRHWYDHSAMTDLLDEDFGLAQKDKLYRCHDLLLQWKNELFAHLRKRWEELFDAKYEILLYDLTSTYFESDPPFDDKRQFGYSRDKRPDCVQVVIALVVTPEGFPIAYEVLPGNTSDKTTLRDMLNTIAERYGEAERIWIMDRGIPTEEVLEEMRNSKIPVRYLVGTPRGRLSKFEKELLTKPWQKVREGVTVKLLSVDGEVYILAESERRIYKERSMRRRRLRKLLKRLEELRKQKTINRDKLLLSLGAAKKDAGRAYGLLDIHLPDKNEAVTEKTFHWKINRKKLKKACRREGRYLLRTNQVGKDPARWWEQYILLTEIEAVFRNLKGDLAIRPIHHQKESRIEAHIFIAFMAYCLHVTLKRLIFRYAPGLTPRSIIEQMKVIQMLDVCIPTTDGRLLKMSRYTKPDKCQQLLLAKLHLTLPKQPPPEIIDQQVVF